MRYDEVGPVFISYKHSNTKHRHTISLSLSSSLSFSLYNIDI